MKPCDLLKHEHRNIEKIVNLISEEIVCIRKTNRVDLAFIDTAADFLETYVRQTHRGKEDLLFHNLSRKVMSEEDFLMMSDLMGEHNTEKIIAEELINTKKAYINGDKQALPLILSKLDTLAALHLDHIKKEENIFFPCAEKYFNHEELYTILRSFREHDEAIIRKNKHHLKQNSAANSIGTAPKTEKKERMDPMLTKIKETVQECAEDIFCSVNTTMDLSSASDLEKKHLPLITAPKKVKKGQRFEVMVEVGKLLEHPNEPGHFIQFIELYAGDTYLARMDLTAQSTCPVMKTCICLDHAHGKLRAFARCNLHGTWEHEVNIEVTD